ncbi:SprT-like domain-containing protein [Pelagibius sp. Alg239-R121]|uniref:SprT-like domain-containing protein n=1 Tax=Pelagibius sp. Alg239-R121 TaxID=2993448 RepID=UPI0024A6B509|nr:SprT-like domain-containing protein [Pelagibius sp. Alg239-R121]
MALTESPTPPTPTQYGRLQRAYDSFNEELFAGELPPCLITLQRQKKVMGYFSRQRFVAEDGSATDEIAMNPEFFGKERVIEVLQTLVHEMCHLWQHHFGIPGRGRYHNEEWADKMESVGLMPSSTGRPGGKRTGDRMNDYPLEGGAFLKVAKALLGEAFDIPWADRFSIAAPVLLDSNEDGESEDGGGAEAAPAPRSKVKYSHECNDGRVLNVWGRPGLQLVCGDCGKVYEADM